MGIENEEILRWWDCSILWGVTSNSLAQLQRGVMSQMRERLFISSFVSILFFFIFSVYICSCRPACQLCVDILYVCLCISLPVPCGCLGVAQECVSVLASVEKRSLHRFEEPNQRLANFPRLLCSSEATAGLLFSPPFRSLLSHLLSSLITEGAAGGLCSSPGFVLTSFIAVALGERASL